MARKLSNTVSDLYAGMRLDSYLFEAGLYPTRSKAVKQIEAGKVFLNGKEPTKKDIVNEGDLIIYEELVEETHVYLEPEDIPLEVYYEDDDLLVINKQPGLICHPSPGHPGGTLSNALIHHYGRENLAHIQAMIVRASCIVWTATRAGSCSARRMTKWVISFKMRSVAAMWIVSIFVWYMGISRAIRA